MNKIHYSAFKNILDYYISHKQRNLHKIISKKHKKKIYNPNFNCNFIHPN